MTREAGWAAPPGDRPRVLSLRFLFCKGELTLTGESAVKGQQGRGHCYQGAEREQQAPTDTVGPEGGQKSQARGTRRDWITLGRAARSRLFHQPCPPQTPSPVQDPRALPLPTLTAWGHRWLRATTGLLEAFLKVSARRSTQLMPDTRSTASGLPWASGCWPL